MICPGVSGFVVKIVDVLGDNAGHLAHGFKFQDGEVALLEERLSSCPRTPCSSASTSPRAFAGNESLKVEIRGSYLSQTPPGF